MDNELKDYVVFKRDGAKKVTRLRQKHLRELKKAGVRYKGMNATTRTLNYTPQDGVTYHQVVQISVHPSDLSTCLDIVKRVDHNAEQVANLKRR